MNKEMLWLLEEKYAGKETPEFFADLKRLKNGEPLAYIIGWVDFLGCRIDLSAHPLIPRPETEFWVEQTITEVRTNYHSFAYRTNYGSSRNRMATGVTDAKVNILDLFAGSGCIGIALLKHLPNITVDLGEKDPKLCKQIKKNIALNDINPKRTRILKTDVFSGVSSTYDIIVANPPYIDPAKRTTVQTSVLTHEPKEGLFAKEHGLFFIKKLLAEGGAHLNDGGKMYIEFGQGQKAAIAKLAHVEGWEYEFWKDQYGKWRVVKLHKE